MKQPLCPRYGCKPGWLIDADGYSALRFVSQSEPAFHRSDRPLQILEGTDRNLLAAQLFGWLKLA